MLYFLNNCQNLDHAKTYGGNAMFDFWADGFEDKIARKMQTGDICLVISRSGKQSVKLARYSFTGAISIPTSSSQPRAIWVLEGKLEHQETLSKTDAASHPKYSRFFNRLGNFNQWSVLRDA